MNDRDWRPIQIQLGSKAVVLSGVRSKIYRRVETLEALEPMNLSQCLPEPSARMALAVVFLREGAALLLVLAFLL
jgi:hypothetical protein